MVQFNMVCVCAGGGEGVFIISSYVGGKNKTYFTLGCPDFYHLFIKYCLLVENLVRVVCAVRVCVCLPLAVAVALKVLAAVAMQINRFSERPVNNARRRAGAPSPLRAVFFALTLAAR